MKTITQKKLSEILRMDRAELSRVLRGKKKVGATRASSLEQITGIGIRTWLFGKPKEIQRDLERIYGRINFKRGRLPKGRRE